MPLVRTNVLDPKAFRCVGVSTLEKYKDWDVGPLVVLFEFEMWLWSCLFQSMFFFSALVSCGLGLVSAV